MPMSLVRLYILCLSHLISCNLGRPGLSRILIEGLPPGLKSRLSSTKVCCNVFFFLSHLPCLQPRNELGAIASQLHWELAKAIAQDDALRAEILADVDSPELCAKLRK